MDTIVFIGPLTSNSHHQDHFIMLSVGDARSLTFLPIVATCDFEDSGAFWLLISMNKCIILWLLSL